MYSEPYPPNPSEDQVPPPEYEMLENEENIPLYIEEVPQAMPKARGQAAIPAPTNASESTFNDLQPEYVYIPSISAHLMVNEISKSLLQQRTDTIIQIDPIDGRKDLYLVKLTGSREDADKPRALRAVLDIAQRGFPRSAFISFPIDQISTNFSLVPWKGVVADGLQFRRSGKPLVIKSGENSGDTAQTIETMEAIRHETRAMIKQIKVFQSGWASSLFMDIQDRIYQVGMLGEKGVQYKIKLTLGKQLYEILKEDKKILYVCMPFFSGTSIPLPNLLLTMDFPEQPKILSMDTKTNQWLHIFLPFFHLIKDLC
jgi:hypothetical protein